MCLWYFVVYALKRTGTFVVSKGLNRYLSILLEESVDFGSMDLLHEEEQIKE